MCVLCLWFMHSLLYFICSRLYQLLDSSACTFCLRWGSCGASNNVEGRCHAKTPCGRCPWACERRGCNSDETPGCNGWTNNTHACNTFLLSCQLLAIGTQEGGGGNRYFMCTCSHRESFAYIIHACVHVRSPPGVGPRLVLPPPPPPPPLLATPKDCGKGQKRKGGVVIVKKEEEEALAHVVF